MTTTSLIAAPAKPSTRESKSNERRANKKINYNGIKKKSIGMREKAS